MSRGLLRGYKKLTALTMRSNNRMQDLLLIWTKLKYSCHIESFLCSHKSGLCHVVQHSALIFCDAWPGIMKQHLSEHFVHISNQTQYKKLNFCIVVPHRNDPLSDAKTTANNNTAHSSDCCTFCFIMVMNADTWVLHSPYRWPHVHGGASVAGSQWWRSESI